MRNGMFFEQGYVFRDRQCAALSSLRQSKIQVSKENGRLFTIE